MKIRSEVLAAFLLPVLTAVAWEVGGAAGIDQWKLKDLTAEPANDAMRLRETGERGWGTAKLRIPVQGEKYLQIQAGRSENPEHFMTAGNVSANGSIFGSLFQGWNTFALPKNSFTLALTLRGPRGSAPGGWYDIATIRTVTIPIGGLTIESDRNVVKIGDSFTVKYYGETSSDTIAVQAYYAGNMAPVNFGAPISLNDTGENGDAKAGDGIYTAEIKVDATATRLLDQEDKALQGSSLIFAATLPGGTFSYGTPGFDFAVATDKAVPDAIPKTNPRTADSRARWQKAVAGQTNLALGKKVEFSFQPNFRNTSRGDTDAADLTDGKLTARSDDILRFDAAAVGWRTGADLSGGIDFIVDLGRVEPVDKAVIRINCGEKVNQYQRSPKSLAAWVSKDGELFYPAAPPMLKLEPGEKDQSDFRTQYYLEENDRDIFCYPFELAIHADARYVMLRIVPDGGNLYCDELAILKAADAATVSDAPYSGPGEKRLTDGIVAAPAENGKFYIADNMAAPNYFRLRDLRPAPGRSELIQVVELPAGIEVKGEGVRAEAIERNGTRYTRFTRAIPAAAGQQAAFFEHQPLFFQAGPEAPRNGARAYFYLTIDGRPSHESERELAVITLPECTQPFRGLTAISRMGIGDQVWPGYFDHLRKLGFSGIQIYPYVYMRRGVDAFPADYRAMTATARECGFKIVLGFNGLLEMYRRDNLPQDEIWCQYPTDIPDRNPCPSYRGKSYQAELDKITRAVIEFKPAYIQWDVEHWGGSMPRVRQCSRCAEGQKKSGKSWEDYLDDLSVELNRDLTAAVDRGAQTAGIPRPEIYNYNRQALNESYHGFEKWALNRQFVAGPMPSLYVAGSELRVHDSIRGNFERQEDKTRRTIIPVLTPGTYGAYEPWHLEAMIYETMLNGGAGFCYFPWRGFVSPVYFYYHARAMNQIIRYQDLIFGGEIFTPECHNPVMTVSGVRNTDEALTLIGNYRRSADGCRIEPPIAGAAARDVLTGCELSAEELAQLSVPPGRFRLLHWRRRP